MAIKAVDQIVREPGTTPPGPTPITSPGAYMPSLPSPGTYVPSLASPLSPGVESVEFNEEEVLKTCQVIFLDAHIFSFYVIIKMLCFNLL